MKTMLNVNNVSISYKLGDFKDIGLKEWTVRHLKHEFHVETFMAVENVSFDFIRLRFSATPNQLCGRKLQFKTISHLCG